MGTVGEYEVQDFDLERVASNVARSVVNNVERLYEHGARQFLIVNMFNMSKIPEASQRSEEVAASYDVLISKHNELLDRYVDELPRGISDNEVNVYRPDVYHPTTRTHRYLASEAIRSVYKLHHRTYLLASTDALVNTDPPANTDAPTQT